MLNRGGPNFWKAGPGLEAYIIDIVRYGDFASTATVCQIHSCLIWLKAFWASADQLKVESCSQADPGVRDVVSVSNIDNLCVL